MKLDGFTCDMRISEFKESVSEKYLNEEDTGDWPGATSPPDPTTAPMTEISRALWSSLWPFYDSFISLFFSSYLGPTSIIQARSTPETLWLNCPIGKMLQEVFQTLFFPPSVRIFLLVLPSFLPTTILDPHSRSDREQTLPWSQKKFEQVRRDVDGREESVACCEKKMGLKCLEAR